jgi:dTMP kinase
MAQKGRFITFEGIDGCGKSTQSRLMFKFLRDNAYPVLWTREPGGSTGAEEIRKLLVEGAPGRWSAETEMLLFNAARRDHLERTIMPALERGETVICDRFADSTRVYQGATRQDLRATVDALHQLMIGVEPDLTFVIDMDPGAALSRGLERKSGEDRFEDFGLSFQKKLRAGFLALTQEFPDRCKLIDGSDTPAAVHADIRALLMPLLT